MKKMSFWGILGLCGIILVCSAGCHIFPWHKNSDKSREKLTEAPKFFADDEIDDEQQLRELRWEAGHSKTSPSSSSKEVRNTSSPFMSSKAQDISNRLDD